MEFFDWSILGTLAGAVAAVAVLTEITKNLPGVRKIPTQIWSYGASTGRSARPAMGRHRLEKEHRVHSARR